jgi:hypothetical protein
MVLFSYTMGWGKHLISILCNHDKYHTNTNWGAIYKYNEQNCEGPEQLRTEKLSQTV